MEVSKSHDPQQGAALMKRTTKHVALDVHQANQECVGPGGERTGDRTDPQQIGSLVITVRRPVTRNAHRCPRTIL